MGNNMDKKNTSQEFAEAVANELIDQLRRGVAPMQQPWNPATGNDWPYNHVTGNRYSGGNALLLMMNKNFQDPRWMTYRQAQSVGAQVRKGESGVSLVKLITNIERNERDEKGKPILDSKGEPVKERFQLENPYFKRFTVFNAQQIDGLPPLEKAPVWEDHERAERLLRLSGADIRHVAGNDAYYHFVQDHIVLPEKKQFPSDGNYYATALHELGHWTGHESRLNREMVGFRQDPAKYAKEELRAEIASLMLSREMGLPIEVERHAHYVGSYIEILQNDPTEILRAARDAERIQQYVLGFERNIGPEPEQAAEPVATLSPLEIKHELAKERYLMQTPLLTATERQERQVMEYMMEKTIAGLSPSAQMQARTNFYEAQIASSVKQAERDIDQPQLEFDR